MKYLLLLSKVQKASQMLRVSRNDYCLHPVAMCACRLTQNVA